MENRVQIEVITFKYSFSIYQGKKPEMFLLPQEHLLNLLFSVEVPFKSYFTNVLKGV